MKKLFVTAETRQQAMWGGLRIRSISCGRNAGIDVLANQDWETNGKSPWEGWEEDGEIWMR